MGLWAKQNSVAAAEDVALCRQRGPGRRSLGSLCTTSADDRRSRGWFLKNSSMHHADAVLMKTTQELYKGVGMCRDV